jgi:hypothetical protein
LSESRNELLQEKGDIEKWGVRVPGSRQLCALKWSSILLQKVEPPRRDSERCVYAISCVIQLSVVSKVQENDEKSEKQT